MSGKLTKMNEKEMSRRKFIGNSFISLGLAYLGLVSAEIIGKEGLFIELPDTEKGSAISSKHKNAILLNGDKKGESNDVLLMSHILKSRGYNIDVINYNQLTWENIECIIGEKAKQSSKNSQTFFYFTGHCNTAPKEWTDGLSINNVVEPDYYSRITPYKLFSMLGEIKGKKAIFLDCCNSGMFTDFVRDSNRLLSSEKLIEDYVVIAACPSDKNTISTNMLRFGRVGALTFEFYKRFKKNSDKPIDLASITLKPGSLYNRIDEKLYPALGLKYDRGFTAQRAGDISYIL